MLSLFPSWRLLSSCKEARSRGERERKPGGDERWTTGGSEPDAGGNKARTRCGSAGKGARERAASHSGVLPARAIGRDPSGSRVALTTVQREDRTAQERNFRGGCPFALLLPLSPKDEGNEEICAAGSLSPFHPPSGHCHWSSRDTRVSVCSSTRAS